MRLLCRYAGGLACLVTALALVACGGGPGSQPEPNQIGNIAFQQGETVRTIPLSDKFNGSDLTYSATTSNRSVATVTVDNDADTLTVTAVGAGTATITVTAENSQGEAEQTFTVTVPQPPAPDPDPDLVEIPDIPSLEKDAIRTIRLGDKFSGENLTYAASSSNERVATVSVNNTANTLTVTAVGPGTATITVTATTQGSADQTETFTVTVPQPGVAPTVRTGATTSVDVAQGGSQTVTLSTVFDGANLTYVVSSSADTVATASESGGTLTITGVSTGPATITIVATNDAGSTTHLITVTVTAPATTTPTPTPTDNPSSCGSPLKIQRGLHKDCTLPAGRSLVYSAPQGEEPRLTVSKPDRSDAGNVWTITAIRKGRPVVQIREDASGNTVAKITVIVPNTPPKRINSAELTVAEFSDVADEAGLQMAVLTGLDGAFTDDDDVDKLEDGSKGIFNYKVQHQPNELLIETKRGFLLDAVSSGEVTIKVAVLKPFKEQFSIEIYAYDRDNDRSDSPKEVNFTATATDPVNPQDGTYDVIQKDNGDLVSVRVGNRLDVKHGLEFYDATGDTRAVFKFASILNGTLADPDSNGKHYLGDASISGTALCGTGDTLNTVPKTLTRGSACYTYTTSNKVEVATDDFDATTTTADAPNIEFVLPSDTNGLNGGSATITIRYHVGAYSARQDPNNIPDPPPSERVHTASEVLTINIHKCVVTSDCPIK